MTRSILTGFDLHEGHGVSCDIATQLHEAAGVLHQSADSPAWSELIETFMSENLTKCNIQFRVCGFNLQFHLWLLNTSF